MANGRCRRHGGKSLKRVASPTFKTGKYSKDLIANLQESYRQELIDPKLVELRDEIAVSRTYIREIMRSGESGKRWSDIEGAFWELDGCVRAGDVPGIRVAMEKMFEIIRARRRDWAHRSEIMQRFEAVRRLVVSEHKHRIDNRMAISQEEMVATVAAYVNIVSRHVNVEQLRAIDRDIGDLCRSVQRGPGDAPHPN
jgi:hypothetical protein